jgi:hypothetical protein
VWSTLVYDFIAYWTWAENGWLHDYGVLDFAGGTPVIKKIFFSFFFLQKIEFNKFIDTC